MNKGKRKGVPVTNVVRGRDDRIFCKYLQYSEDVIENQVLKATLIKAAQFLGVYFKGASGKSSYGEMITFCNKSLEHVQRKKYHLKI